MRILRLFFQWTVISCTTLMQLFYKYNSWSICWVTYFIFNLFIYSLSFIRFYKLIYLFFFWNNNLAKRKLFCSFFLRTFLCTILNSDMILLPDMRKKEIIIVRYGNLIFLGRISRDFLFWKCKILSLFYRFRFNLFNIFIYTSSHERISWLLSFWFLLKKLINFKNIFFLSARIMLTFNINKPFI